MSTTSIPGYALGTAQVSRSPLSDADFSLIKQTVLMSDEDLRHLRLAGEVLADQVEAVLDVWYGFVGGHPHLLTYFSGEAGQPSAEYLGAVRRRFGRWILDLTSANFDRAWLDYQYEIGLRHTRLKKNTTDGVASAAPVIHMRYLIAFIVPLTVTMKPFLAAKGHSAHEVEQMHQAWFKAVTMTALLWSQPYVPAQDF
jgi:Protoglobin